jgi:hypothetical protein
MNSDRIVQRWDDDVVLIDLGGSALTRIAPRRPAGPALVLAVFTMVTCAGLTLSTNDSRVADGSAPDHPARDGAVSPGAISDSDPRPGSSATDSSMRSGLGPSGGGLVGAGARAIRGVDGALTIRVSGVAQPGVTAIDVRVRIGGSVVGFGAGRVDPTVAIGADGGFADELAPWSADIPLTSEPSGGGDDSVATVEVRWFTGADGSAGVRGLVVTLGDGRASD